MNNINVLNNDYEIFKIHYNGMCELRDAINPEISTLASDWSSASSIRKLLKLREFVNEAIKFCGETMYNDICLIGHELILKQFSYLLLDCVHTEV